MISVCKTHAADVLWSRFFYTCVSSSHENKIDQYQKSMNLQCVNVQESKDICCIYPFEKLDRSRTHVVQNISKSCFSTYNSKHTK